MVISVSLHRRYCSLRKILQWERLKEVFEKLRKANLKLKPSKVKLFQREITFLGHVVSGDGISMDPEKIKEVVERKTPSNAHEVRQF